MSITKMNASNFQVKFQEQDLDSLHVEEDVNCQNHSVSISTKRILSNSIFKKLVIPDYKFQTLTIRHCRIEHLEIPAAQYNLLHIHDCEIGELIIKDKNVTSNLTIAHNHIERIAIKCCSINNITIDDNNFAELEIFNLRNNTHLQISQTKTTKDKQENDHVVELISLHGKLSNVTIANLKIINIELKEASIINGFTLKHLDVSGKICSSKSTANATSDLIDLNVNCCELDFRNVSDQPVRFRGGKYGSITIPNPLTSLSFEGYELEQVKHVLEVGCVDLSKSIRIHSLNIYESKIGTLNVNNLRSTQVKVVSSVITDQLNLEQATLEDGKFYNLDLTKCKIRLLNTTLTGSEIINVRWPKGYRFHEYAPERKGKHIPEQLVVLWSLKETYRQMKVLSLVQHNKIDALYFQKQELKIFWKITQMKTLHESFWANIGNWFILGTNRLFSDFGQNIWRPLIALGLVHFIWFMLLLIFHFDIFPCIWDCDAELTKGAVNAYFVTLLPTHGTQLTIAGEVRDIGGWVDFFMRVFSGYFIFYFVYSSRKYHQ